MSSLAILVPVLGRPERVGPLLESIRGATPDATVLFLTSPRDRAEIFEITAIDRDPGVGLWTVGWNPGRGDYARKINAGFRIVALDHEWVFLGADDLSFRPGWFEACLARRRSTLACVIGTNDLGNQRTANGLHSTHTLVHRDYLQCGTADEDDVILHEGYDHQFVDDELVQTAIDRGTFVHARHAVVEHLHPDWGKGARDATYDKARAEFSRDRDLYHRRKHLWGK